VNLNPPIVKAILELCRKGGARYYPGIDDAILQYKLIQASLSGRIIYTQPKMTFREIVNDTIPL
jgi:hypothetical protein